MENEKPLVSIITTAYNSEKWIRTLADSILAQDYPNLEWVVVNDGSTDSTESIVFEYRDRFAALKGRTLKVKYIKQANAGLGSATLTGMHNISGAYFTQIDSDNYYKPGAISKLYEALASHPEATFAQADCQGFRIVDGKEIPDIQFSYAYQIDSDLMNSNSNPLLYFALERKGFMFGLWFVDARKYRQINPTLSFTPLRKLQDAQILGQLYASCQKVYVPEVLLMMYFRPGSLSQDAVADPKIFDEEFDALRSSIDFLQISSQDKERAKAFIGYRCAMSFLAETRKQRYRASFHRYLKFIIATRKAFPELKAIGWSKAHYLLSYALYPFYEKMNTRK